MIPTLKFYTLFPELINEMPVTKASHKDFEWVKKAYEDYKANPNVYTHTSKCPGIMSIMSTGYIQRTYQTVTITPDSDGFHWHTEIDQKKLKYGTILQDYVSAHEPNALYDFKKFQEGTLPTLVKIQSPWLVDIPKGYSLLVMPIPYHDNVTFTSTTGILKGFSFCNAQLYIHSLKDKVVIPKGTPLCQYILLKDEEVAMELTPINGIEQFLELYKSNKNIKEVYKILEYPT